MGLFVLLALQTAAATTPPPMARIDFDLRRAEAFDPAEVRPLRIWAGDCGVENGDEIVVCGRLGRDAEAQRYRIGPLLPDPPTAMDELGDALSTSLGPLEIGSIRQPDGTRRFGIGMKF